MTSGIHNLVSSSLNACGMPFEKAYLMRRGRWDARPYVTVLRSTPTNAIREAYLQWNGKNLGKDDNGRRHVEQRGEHIIAEADMLYPKNKDGLWSACWFLTP